MFYDIYSVISGHAKKTKKAMSTRIDARDFIETDAKRK